jgi:hypothetical protein
MKNINDFLLELGQALEIEMQEQELSFNTLEELEDVEEIKALSLPIKYTCPY